MKTLTREVNATCEGLHVVNMAYLSDRKYEWLWHGHMARRCITLLEGRTKVGTTTLVATLLKLMENGGTLDGEVKPGRVLVVSEESTNSWHDRCEKLGIGDHVEFLCRPLREPATHDEWVKFLEELVYYIQYRAFSLVIFDKYLNVGFPSADEQDLGAIRRALAPFRIITSTGAALLLVHNCQYPRPDDRIVSSDAPDVAYQYFRDLWLRSSRGLLGERPPEPLLTSPLSWRAC